MQNVIRNKNTESNLLRYIEIIDDDLFIDDGVLILAKSKEGIYRYTIISLRFSYKNILLRYQIVLPFIKENKMDEFWIDELEINKNFQNYQLIQIIKGDYHLNNPPFKSSINITKQ